MPPTEFAPGFPASECPHALDHAASGIGRVFCPMCKKFPP